MMSDVDYLQKALIQLIESAVTLALYAGAGAILLITTTKIRRHNSNGLVAAAAAGAADMQMPWWFWLLDVLGVVCSFFLAFFNVVVQLTHAVVDVGLIVVAFALRILWLVVFAEACD